MTSVAAEHKARHLSEHAGAGLVPAEYVAAEYVATEYVTELVSVSSTYLLQRWSLSTSAGPPRQTWVLTGSRNPDHSALPGNGGGRPGIAYLAPTVSKAHHIPSLLINKRLAVRHANKSVYVSVLAKQRRVLEGNSAPWVSKVVQKAFASSIS